VSSLEVGLESILQEDFDTDYSSPDPDEDREESKIDEATDQNENEMN